MPAALQPAFPCPVSQRGTNGQRRFRRRVCGGRSPMWNATRCGRAWWDGTSATGGRGRRCTSNWCRTGWG